MKQCSSCRGDGLKHPHATIFQIVEDRPCRECRGKGTVVGRSKVFDDLTDVPYLETTVVVQKEYPARIYYQNLEEYGISIVDILIGVGQNWYILNVDDLQLKDYTHAIKMSVQ